MLDIRLISIMDCTLYPKDLNALTPAIIKPLLLIVTIIYLTETAATLTSNALYIGSMYCLAIRKKNAHPEDIDKFMVRLFYWEYIKAIECWAMINNQWASIRNAFCPAGPRWHLNFQLWNSTKMVVLFWQLPQCA